MGTREIKAQKNESIKINKSFNLKDLIMVASARITHTSLETKNSTIVSLDKKVSPLILIKKQRTMIKSISGIYGERKQFIKFGNSLLVANIKFGKKWNYFHSYGLPGIQTNNLIKGYKRNEVTVGRHCTILSGDLYRPFFNKVTGTLSMDIGFGLGDSKITSETMLNKQSLKWSCGSGICLNSFIGNLQVLLVINDQMKGTVHLNLGESDYKLHNSK